jgi:hypothetical protein
MLLLVVNPHGLVVQTGRGTFKLNPTRKKAAA